MPAQDVSPCPSDRAQTEARIEHLLGQVERSESAAARAALLAEVARVYALELDDPDRAFTALLAADEGQDDADRREELHRLAAATGRWAELAAHLGNGLPFVASSERADAATRLGALYLERIGDHDRAIVAANAALAIDPGHAGAMLLRLEVLDQRVPLVADEERAALRREAAAHLVTLGRPLEAIARYEEIRAAIPADVETLGALERLYAAAHPREHVEVLSCLAGAVGDGQERTALHRRLVAGWQALGDPARAAEALEWVLASDEGDDQAYEQLARLYREAGHWRAAVDAISRHVARADPARHANLYLQLGMLFEEHIEDPWRAIDYYELANQLAPRSEGTLVALGRLYEHTSAYERAATRLEEAAQIARTEAARAGRLARAATLLLTQREGADRSKWAERLLREALAAQPGYPPAARALAELHRERGELRCAAALLAGAVNHAADEDERADLLLAAGRIEEALGEEERALACYRRALEADPSRRDAQLRKSEMLFSLGLDHELLPLLEQLCEDEPELDVRADRLVRLARVLEAIGDRPRAFAAVLHAQEVVPQHFEAQRLEGELLFSDARWAEARGVLALVAEQGEAAGLTARELAHVHARIGACAIALADSRAAQDAIEVALRLDPDHLGALKRAVEIYAEHGQWLAALAAAERIAAADPDRKLRARYWQVAARICAEELSMGEDAIVRYRRALDEDPELDGAALALERLLVVSGDTSGLMALYTQRIQQLGPVGGPGDDERLRLWAALADSCEAMGDREATRVALEVATKIDGSRLELRARLADACVSAGADHLDRAIAEHREILARDKGRIASYHALAELYERTARPALARACTDAARQLVCLGLAEGPLGLGAIDAAIAPAGAIARRPLGDRDWSLLRDRDEDPALSALWMRIAPLITELEASSHRALRLDPREAIVAGDSRPFAIAAREAARLLGAAQPSLHVRHEQVHPARFLNARSEDALCPALLIGTPLLGDRRSQRDLLFSLSLRLVHLRPERLLRLALPDPAALSLLVQTVMALVAEGEGKGRTVPGRTAEALRAHLSPLAFDQMIGVGRHLVERGEDPGALVRRWLRATDLTAGRAALALSGDLPRALRALLADDQQAFAGQKERVLDLCWASATEEFLEVRARIADLVGLDGGEAGAWESARGSLRPCAAA